MKALRMLTGIIALLFFGQINSAFAENKTISNVPYIHQVLDMDGSEFDGNWACGPTSAVMVVKFHHLQPNPPAGKPAGYYVYNPYVGFKDKSGQDYSMVTARDRDSNEVKGVYGYTINSSGNAVDVKIAEYLQNHGLTIGPNDQPWTNDEATFQRIKHYIDSGLPVIAHWNWYRWGYNPQSVWVRSRIGGHFMVIIGYDTGDNGTQRQVICNDPYGNRNGVYGSQRNGSEVVYNFPMAWQKTAINEETEFDRFIFVRPLGVYEFYPGWFQNNQLYNSQAFVDCYNRYGGEDTFGIPWNNGSGNVWVHAWPDGQSSQDTIWLQDYLTKDGHWWQLALNQSMKEVFPVHGKLLTFWHNNWGYSNYGPPASLEYNARDSNNHLLVIQEFSKNGIVRYLGYDTAAKTSREYNFFELRNIDRSMNTDNTAYLISLNNPLQNILGFTTGRGGVDPDSDYSIFPPAPTPGSSQASNPWMDCQENGIQGSVKTIPGSDVGNWVKLGNNMFPALSQFAYASDLDGNVLLYGGFKTENGRNAYSYDTWYYDNANSTWNNVTPPDNCNVSNRAQTAICYDQARNEFILVGGDNPNSDTHFSDVCLSI